MNNQISIINCLKILMVIGLFIFLLPHASADIWQSDSNIVTGLTIGANGWAKPAAFYDSGMLKLIVGEKDGGFTGWDWNGTAWESNSSIVTGLGIIGTKATPEVFYMDGTWYLISGEYDTGFYGFHWNGTSWISNSTIISGLPIKAYTAPAVFNDSGTWKLIFGWWSSGDDDFYGYQWNGTGWEENSTLVSGLAISDAIFTPTTFNDDGTWKLITGTFQGHIYGFYWSGSTWVLDSSIRAGLPADFGSNTGPELFFIDGTQYLIIGEASPVFNGFILNVSSTPSNLMTEHVTDNLHIVTNVSTPYFNWTYSDPDGDTQSYWQVQVGTTPGSSNMWDTGSMSGTDTSDIYAGSTLNTDNTYYVQVRTHDGVTWSDWETGIFAFGYNVSGIVTSLGPTVGANVTIVGIGSDITNATGYYSFSSVLPDTYTITATALSHKDYSDTVTVSSDDVTKNITMNPTTNDSFILGATISNSQNTALQAVNTSFGNMSAGTSLIISPSFNLTNSGNRDANISATFITSYSGIYGFDGTTDIIGGSNFSLQKDSGTWDVLNNIVDVTELTDTVIANNVAYDWNTKLVIPAGQAHASYLGTVEFTFS